MAKTKEKYPVKEITVDAQELAYTLTDLGDALASLQKKVYAVTRDRIATATRRLRIMLRVEGTDEH
jgi:hypothetical protein